MPARRSLTVYRWIGTVPGCNPAVCICAAASLSALARVDSGHKLGLVELEIDDTGVGSDVIEQQRHAALQQPRTVLYRDIDEPWETFRAVTTA